MADVEPIVIIDPRTPPDAIDSLMKMGFTLMPIPLTKLVSEPIAGHPDIQLFIHDENIFVHPDINKNFLNKIGKYFNITICHKRLSKKYPDDITYNIAGVGKTVYHKANAMDNIIFKYLERQNIDIIHTAQGYSKCSILVVNDESIITSDMSIHRAAIARDHNSLLISQGYIDLPGYSYGFIGGASGRFMDTIVFTGSLSGHPDIEKIYEFIENRGLKIKFLSNKPAIDTGSIFFYQ